MESKHEQFRRTLDGVIGVGFVQTHTGIPTAAIAWPDTEPRRYLMSDMEGYGIELILDEGHWDEEAEAEAAINAILDYKEANASAGETDDPAKTEDEQSAQVTDGKEQLRAE